MTTIVANVTKMFALVAPEYVSGSQAELGDQAGRMTWLNARTIAERHTTWLSTPIADAAEYMRDWARSTGAWEDAEIVAWDDYECLALFAQNVASEIRTCLNADEDFDGIEAVANGTDWEQEGEYPVGSYSRDAGGDTIVDYYTDI